MSFGLRRNGFSARALAFLPLALAFACDSDRSAGDPATGLGGGAALPDPPAQDPSGTPDVSEPREGQDPGELVAAGGMPSAVAEPPVPATRWFSDDFESGTSDNWALTPGEGAAFAVVVEPGTENHVLQYSAGSTTDNLIALITDAAWAATEAKAGVTPLADYYVQARLKPQSNSTTSNKQLFLLARYRDAQNWYFGGLNVQTSLSATQVEGGARKAGAISRTVQGQREVVQGTQGQADGQWYMVRFDVAGSALDVYLDGEHIGSAEDAEFTSGKIGLFTANKSFLLDDIVVGDRAVGPASLVLSPPTLQRTVEAETEPFQIDVRALLSDGTTPDAFSAVSDDAAVLSVSIAGSALTLSPLTSGVAHVTITSGSEPLLSKILTLTVTPPYRDAPGAIPGLSAVAQPSLGQTEVPVDTRLALTFDAPPRLGTGSIRIFRASDDSVVDSISLGAETDRLGPPTGTSGGRVRHVNFKPIEVEGNVVRIKPHSRVLEYGTEYYVGVADGAVSGTLAGAAFAGIGAQAGWRFTTRMAPPVGADVSVDDDGESADFRSVQGALDHVMQNVAADTPATISVSNGVYHELLFARGKNNLTIRGESRDGVRIEYANFETINPGTGASTATPGAVPAGGRSLFLIESSDLITLTNLTLANPHRRTGVGDQAETVYFNADAGRLIATDMRFTSEQDTLELKGYSWFYGSLIEGNVDFIWGNNRVALFENSEIRTLGDSRSTTASGGYVLQARTVTAADKGFVFLNSSLTQATGPAGTLVAPGGSYLARSGGSATYFDNVTFINCKLDTHIAALGWAELGVNGQPAPNPAIATATSGWKEFGSQNLLGEPLNLASRAASAHVLTAAEVAANYASRAQIFAAFNGGAGWNPAP